MSRDMSVSTLLRVVVVVAVSQMLSGRRNVARLVRTAEASSAASRHYGARR
jgi:hypothetical protein